MTMPRSDLLHLSRSIIAVGKMNENSSRSHSIVEFTISSTNYKSRQSGGDDIRTRDRTTVDGEDGGNHDAAGNVEGGSDGDAVPTRARLSLVDLAGSEKGRGLHPKQGQEWERSRINSSLSALSNCIACLGEAGRIHVPFRDSPLTR